MNITRTPMNLKKRTNQRVRDKFVLKNTPELTEDTDIALQIKYENKNHEHDINPYEPKKDNESESS